MAAGKNPLGYTRYELAEERGDSPMAPVGDNALEVWEKLPGHPEYVVVGKFHIREGGPQLIGLMIEPWGTLPWPPPMLTTVMYRRAPLDLLYERARGYAAISREIGLTLEVDLNEFAQPRPGRTGRPDVFYAELAREYVELLSSSSTPTKDLAERLGYGASSVRDFLHKARERGLLTSPSKGMAGGELTNKAMWLLAAEGETGA